MPGKEAKMKMIDAHLHVFRFRQHWSEWAAKQWIEQASNPIHWVTGKKLQPKDFDAPYDWAVEVMNNAGVKQAFMLGNWQTPHNIKVPTTYLAEAIQKYPDRFYGFCAPDPLAGSKSVDELEWAITEKGFIGLKVVPTYNYVPSLDRRIWPLYEKAHSLGIPIVIHSGSGVMPRNKIVWQEPYALEDLLIEFQDINISFGHTGFHRVLDALMMMIQHKNLYGDFAYWHFLPFDFLARSLVFAKKIGVFDRLMWGTDFPHVDPRADSERWKKIPEYTRKHELEPLITDQDLVQFFSENALRFVKKTNR